MVAYSIGSYCAQIPPLERKSGIPLSVLTPAPVRTTHGCRSRIRRARRSGTSPEGERAREADHQRSRCERCADEPAIPLAERATRCREGRVPLLAREPRRVEDLPRPVRGEPRELVARGTHGGTVVE